MKPIFRPARILTLLSLFWVLPAVQAASWKKEPQPLVAGPEWPAGSRYVVKATPGSNLAFDSSWRILWSVQNNTLQGHIWKRTYLDRLPLSAPEQRQVRSGSALVADTGWHMVYFISPEGRLRVMGKTGSSWLVTDTIPGNITQVLGVHKDWHTVFAYDAGQRAVLAVYWSAKDGIWKSQTIATNVGDVSTEGVVDLKRHVLYFTAQDAPSHGVPSLPGVLQPWPLMGAWWDGGQWKSQAVVLTGVPQRPAHDPSDDCVYYANRGDVEGLRSFRPSTGKLAIGERKYVPDLLTRGTFKNSAAPVFNQRLNWHGAPTWMDDDHYPVDLGAQSYFGNPGSVGIYEGGSWFTINYIGSTLTMIGGTLTYVGPRITINNGATVVDPEPSQPRAHQAVSAWVPQWEPLEEVPGGLRQFRAVISPRRGEIIQQRVSEDPWTRQEANGWQRAEHIYRDSTDYQYYRLGPGVITSRRVHYNLRVTDHPGALSTYVWEPYYLPDEPPVITVDGVSYYDPAHPDVVTVAPNEYRKSLTALLGHGAREATDPASLPPQLVDVQNSSAGMHTFGHRLSDPSPRTAAPGGRYQSYLSGYNSRAQAGGIACDTASTAVFYVQAPKTTGEDSWIVVVN